jgi:PAS domain S-box-containing protein
MPTVLIVDDNAANLYLLQTLLSGHAFDVTQAENGRLALERARRSPPSLILSDILMPVMDGFTLCREWRADERLRDIPFVFYTATYTDPRDEQLALSLGADDFIVKPMDPDELMARIRGALARHTAGERPRPPTEPAGETTLMKEYNEALIRKLEDKVSQLEMAEEALAIKDLAIHSSVSGIALADLSDRITYVNEAFVALLGRDRSRLVGEDVISLFTSDEARKAACAALRAEGQWVGELDIRRDDDGRRTLHVAAHVVRNGMSADVGYMFSCVDVSSHKRLIETIERNDKLESLSLLASGVAHDFNNLLTGLYGNLEMALRRTPADSPARPYLDTTMGVFERARDLTKRLMTFSKGCSPRKTRVCLADLLRECVALSLSGSGAQCELSLPADLPDVEADPSQLSQVFNNVIINARQAMDPGGRLHVAARGRALAEGEVADLPAGKYVELALRDEGPGIAPELVPKLFEPFFTTKPEGSGLGLATSRSILGYFGGQIAIESAPGKGTTVTVWLPAAERQAKAAERQPAPGTKRGCGRVLVMDDEHSIRELAYTMLSAAGYQVTAVPNGEAAIDAFKAALTAGKPYDVALLDLTIRGGMGGVETAAALRKLDGDTALVLSSGYSDDSLLARTRTEAFAAMIPKPYLQHELITGVEAVISRRRS